MSSTVTPPVSGLPFDVFRADGLGGFELLSQGADRVLYRRSRRSGPDQSAILIAMPAVEHPARAVLDRLAHEYELRDGLDRAWAVRPVELSREAGRTMLVLEDPGGELLDRHLAQAMAVEEFLRLAINLSAALHGLHQRGIIHKDIKPANVFYDPHTGQAWLTGFGIASRLPRERQAPAPPEVIAGTFAYMAPEQTGRMNRSIDARSDLYALGITLYQCCTGALPFSATDPMEWVHCHIARQPLPPAERSPAVPGPVSAVIMRLLAKTAEERYQTAAGVAQDLQRCLADWQRQGTIDEFPLGQQDTPGRLLISEKLYGREREITTLLSAFDRATGSGAAELVLVSGYSGIGKSSVVNELHKVLVLPRGLFAAGKFDQYNRDIPYATLAQALHSLVRSLLGKSDAALAPWRDALREALGPNGQLMVDLVPILEALIGPQSPVSELPPQEAQRRFQLVFARMLGVFARPEHPLTLFLDDLQWLDIATLDILEHLATQSDLRNLLLVGAYRDNEVTDTHPLMRRLAAIRNAGGRVQEIVLSPLRLSDVERLIADALRSEPGFVSPLARLVHEKTAGNPFFTVEFFTALAEEGLLVFDHAQGRWSWELERIQNKGYTENVVDLMLGKLQRLPVETQRVLQLMACLGNEAAAGTLATVHDQDEAAVDVAMWPAMQAGLVVHSDGLYRFVHDRVQEAGYGLIPESNLAKEHLRIGRLLEARAAATATEESVFDIVRHLNRGAALLTSVEERERLAELNLLAGKRAKATMASNSALGYFVAGEALLGDQGWQSRPDIAFALALNRAECEFLTGALADAESRLAMLSARAGDLLDRAAITCLQIELYTTLDRSDRSVEVTLDYLRGVDITWSAHPASEDVEREYERIWQQIGSRPIEALFELPQMDAPVWKATMEVLAAAITPALYTDENLYCLVIGRMANTSLEHGNSDASGYGYAILGTVLGRRFNDYKSAFRFGELGFKLVTQLGLDRFKARVYVTFGHHIIPWTKHIRTSRELLQQALDAAHDAGDLTYGAFSRTHFVTHLLACGDPLDAVQRAADAGLDFARQSRFGLVVDRITGQRQLIRTLRGLTPAFGCFDEDGFDEAGFEQHLAADSRLALAACWYWIRKLQARVLAGDHAAAMIAAAQAERLLWTSPAFFERAEYHFYAALARAAACGAPGEAEREAHLDALAAHHHQLREWSGNCPENFEHRAALVGAEIARLRGRDREAIDLYERAVRLARANGFVHNEAIANEIASHFYTTLGLETSAHAYLRNARHCYVRWGAVAKVMQLDEKHPELAEAQQPRNPTSTFGVPVEYLDLATVTNVLQTASSEIVLGRLLDTLMRSAIEQAGAERGLLLLPFGSELRIAAEARTRDDAIVVQSGDVAVTAAALPESILHYVQRTHELVLLDDASARNPFVADPYIDQHQARSVLCLPLINQTKLIGVLYLENNLGSRAFVPARIAVLKLLASQAAISLENARLYRDLEEREAKIRRLADSSIIGIFMWNFDGRILEANDAFLHMLGYDRHDLADGRMLWTGLSPPEWRDRSARGVDDLKKTGVAQPYEKEYLRRDGSRVPVLVGATTFEENGNQGVSFVLDLTERKRAEDALRQLESDFAHMNRVSMLGGLAASLAHEITQPIASARNNARAAQNFLEMAPPDLGEAIEAITSVVSDTDRVGDIIGGIREQIRKSPPRKDRFDLNAAIAEVATLARSMTVRSGVLAEIRLADGLPPVQGDRVQLQQVMLNLVLNAVEAMGSVEPAARELLISTEREPTGVVVAVRDSGPGIDPAHIERVFEAFYTTKPSGTGMGLAICRSIIDAHRGKLWASVNEPRGAVFRFTLPNAEEELAAGR